MYIVALFHNKKEKKIYFIWFVDEGDEAENPEKSLLLGRVWQQHSLIHISLDKKRFRPHIYVFFTVNKSRFQTQTKHLLIL